MELREMGDRLLRLHAELIIVAFLAGVLGAFAIHLRDQPLYQANVLFVMGAPDPQNASSAAVLADTARGIATGPRLVARAISEVGVSRDETKVADAVDVQTVGSSGVLTLSVMDPEPRVAVNLANALADGVVATRFALTQNGLASSLRGLDQQEAAADARVRKLNTRIESLTAQIAATSSQAGLQNSMIAQLNELQARLTSLQDLATQIAVQRNNLEAQQGPKTSVIDKAVSAVGVPGRGLLDVLLGGIIGLVVGIVIAAAWEAVRPSLVGATAISRAIGAPLLGEMSTPPDSWTLGALPDAGTYIELAADAQHVQEVRFAALAPNGRHRAQVRMLAGPLHRLSYHSPARNMSAEAAHDGSSAGQVPAVTTTAPASAGPDGMSSLRTGLVVAMPKVLKVADLDAVTNFIWISGWTLLGVIVYSPSRKKITIPRRSPGPASPPRNSSVGQQMEVDA
jgi:capsular polysaccharide biosynthesis protein